MDNYLAVFTANQSGATWQKWMALSPEERAEKSMAGMKAWQEWMAKYGDQVVVQGGPLGKTKQASGQGICDYKNNLCAYTVVRAASHEEAANMFAGHPHFMLFPGDTVEIMPVLPIPTEADMKG